MIRLYLSAGGAKTPEALVMLSRHRAPLARVAGALASGSLLALGGSLNPSWGAAWIASVPVLVAAFTSTGRVAWEQGVVAGLIGGLSILGYYATRTSRCDLPPILAGDFLLYLYVIWSRRLDLNRRPADHESLSRRDPRDCRIHDGTNCRTLPTLSYAGHHAAERHR
jgi:hypothetical protein